MCFQLNLIMAHCRGHQTKSSIFCGWSKNFGKKITIYIEHFQLMGVVKMNVPSRFFSTHMHPHCGVALVKFCLQNSQTIIETL